MLSVAERQKLVIIIIILIVYKGNITINHDNSLPCLYIGKLATFPRHLWFQPFCPKEILSRLPRDCRKTLSAQPAPQQWSAYRCITEVQKSSVPQPGNVPSIWHTFKIYIHACIYLHMYIHTLIHTYTHTYMH